MITDRLHKTSRFLLTGWVLAASAICAHAAVTDISTFPLNRYKAANTVDVKPNVLFVLDDSGSMDWDFMPDWACASYSTRNSTCGSTGQNPSSVRAEYLFRSAQYNGVYYNPAITYTPPTAVDSTGATNSTTFPSMTGTSAATGADMSSSLPNWKAVKDDAYGIQSSLATVSDLQTDATKPAYYYTIVPVQYCAEPALINCTAATAPTTSYPYPVTVKWCNSSGLSTCRATFASAYAWARSPSPSMTTFTVTGTTSSSVSQISVGGYNIMAAAVAASTNATTVAQGIVDQINKCQFSASGSCTVAGYTASLSSGTVTIVAPATTTATPSITKTGSMLSTPGSFSAANTISGKILRTVITPVVNSYPYPGTNAKAGSHTECTPLKCTVVGAGRTDCAGATCTYNEEMANYANWWTYYKSRMQMMKTAVSNAFAAIDTPDDAAANISRYRLGFMTINNNQGTDFINPGEFKGTQKYNWYTKFIRANPSNSTPLRKALSTTGRLYAGKLAGSNLNGVSVVDPLQYACQKNYAILSTDGFWNESDTLAVKMNGTTQVANQDAALPRPFRDAGSAQIQMSISNLQSRTITPTVLSSTSNLQSRTLTSTPAPAIQMRTSANSGATWTAWADAASCTVDTSGSTRTDCKFPTSTSSDSGATWAAWSYLAVNATCTPDTTGSSRRACSGSVNIWGAWANAASCTTSSTQDCQYTAWTGYAPAASCTPLAQSASSPYSVDVATQCAAGTPVYGPWINASSCTASSTQGCQYTGWGSWGNVSSCNSVPQSASPNYTVSQAIKCQTNTTGGSSNTLSDVAAYYYGNADTDDHDLRNSDASKGTGTCTGPIISPATSPTDLCEDIVPATTADPASWQHLTTSTLGLGAQGQMVFTPDYATSTLTTNDFFAMKSGATADPAHGVCPWQASGTVCNWPAPASNTETTIDDLWHAAINGHGSYYSATDPQSLTEGLSKSIAALQIVRESGIAASAANSNPNVVSGDNFIFSSNYTTVDWYGELIRQTIITDDPDTELIGTLSAQNWSAQKLLDCTTTDWMPSHSYNVGDVYGHDTTCYLVKTNYLSGATFDATVDSVSSVDTTNTSVIHIDETATPLVNATRQTLSNRKIYFNSGGNMTLFNWGNLGGAQSYFTKAALTYVSSTVGLSNFCASGAGCLTSTQQDDAAGNNLVEFLRGAHTYEGTYYRSRAHTLGDIVTSEARYVKQPIFEYTDDNYLTYKDDKANRAPMVYVAANDGMLHAFSAVDGQEAWAYVPSFVLPNLYKLADPKYSANDPVTSQPNHQYFVDGTPEVGDYCPNAPVNGKSTCARDEWRTILIGGLNRGGKGYYALDITNPASPRLLWEFTHARLGYSYGNPKLTKLKNGRWVVMFASGYNNSDGVGRLFVLDANTGVEVSGVSQISTGVGSAATPSGLARISGHAPTPLTDNTTFAVYGGDTLGNLWRFDINGDIGSSPSVSAFRMVTFKDKNDSSKPQPITVRSVESTIDPDIVMVYVGTGRYLGISDIADNSYFSFYGIHDKLDTTTTYMDPHASGSGFVQQVLTSHDNANGTACPGGNTFCSDAITVLTITNNAVSLTDSTVNGWYIDFVNPGERNTTDPNLSLGTLLFTTIQPSAASADPCKSGKGNSFLYAVDYLSGGAVGGGSGSGSGSGGGSAGSIAGVGFGEGVVTKPVTVRLENGDVKTYTRIDKACPPSDPNCNTIIGSPPVVPPGSGTGVTRRVSWRELPTQK